MVDPPQAGRAAEQRVKDGHDDGREGRDQHKPTLRRGIIGANKAESASSDDRSEEPWHCEDCEETPGT